jgi:hypothetical protein
MHLYKGNFCCTAAAYWQSAALAASGVENNQL